MLYPMKRANGVPLLKAVGGRITCWAAVSSATSNLAHVMYKMVFCSLVHQPSLQCCSFEKVKRVLKTNRTFKKLHLLAIQSKIHGTKSIHLQFFFLGTVRVLLQSCSLRITLCIYLEERLREFTTRKSKNRINFVCSCVLTESWGAKGTLRKMEV
jgi:hypothetical protein